MPTVPGSYQIADWVAPKSLWLMKNQLKALDFASFDYQDQFTDKQFSPGDSVRVKLPQMFTVVDGFEYSPQAIDRRSTSITIDNPCQIPFEWDSYEKALKLERTQAQIEADYLNPAMFKMAVEADARFMRFIKNNTPNVVGALGTTPTSWATYAGGQTRMAEQGGTGPRIGMLLSPQMMETFIANNLVSNFNPSEEISKQYRKGVVGMAAGAEWFRIQSCPTHTTGIWATVATGVTVNGNGQSGNSIICAATTGDTVVPGDTVTFASCTNVNQWTLQSTGRLRQFKIAQAATAASSAITLVLTEPIIGPGSPYQNVTALPATSDVVTLSPGTSMSNAAAKSGVYGVAITEKAFLAAGVKLMMPQEGGPVEIARQMTDPNTGLSVAFWRQLDPVSRKMINRFDSLFGFGRGWSSISACLIASLV